MAHFCLVLLSIAFTPEGQLPPTISSPTDIYLYFWFKDESAALLNNIVEATVKRTDLPVSFLEKMAETIFKSVANIQDSVANGLSIDRNGSVHSCTDKIKVNMLSQHIKIQLLDWNMYCGRNRDGLTLSGCYWFSKSLYLSVRLLACLSACLPACLSFYFSVCLSVVLPFSRSVVRVTSVSLSVCLSVCLLCICRGHFYVYEAICWSKILKALADGHSCIYISFFYS